MSSYNDFINIGKPWSDIDDQQLIKLYNEDLLDINQLSVIYKRAPGGISARVEDSWFCYRQTESGLGLGSKCFKTF